MPKTSKTPKDIFAPPHGGLVFTGPPPRRLPPWPSPPPRLPPRPLPRPRPPLLRWRGRGTVISLPCPFTVAWAKFWLFCIIDFTFSSRSCKSPDTKLGIAILLSLFIFTFGGCSFDLGFELDRLCPGSKFDILISLGFICRRVWSVKLSYQRLQFGHPSILSI